MATKKKAKAKPTGISGENSGTKRGRVENLKPFQPGQSGNPGGRPKNVITGMIEQELAKAVKGDKEARTWLQLMVQGAIRQAVKGDIRAFSEITDRVQGKAMQAVQMSGPQGGAIPIESMSREESWRRITEILARGGMKIVPISDS